MPAETNDGSQPEMWFRSTPIGAGEDFRVITRRSPSLDRGMVAEQPIYKHGRREASRAPSSAVRARPDKLPLPLDRRP